jgi:hypothetical protein
LRKRRLFAGVDSASFRHLYCGVAAGFRGIHGGYNEMYMRPLNSGDYCLPKTMIAILRRKILLIFHVLVGRKQHVVPGRIGGLEQFAVAQAFLSETGGWVPVLPDRTKPAFTARGQRPGGLSRLRAANSITAFTCSRSSPSNHSIMSSMLAPASMFSKIADTGIRVPFRTHAPLTLPGMLSTARHWDQSRLAIICAPLSGYRDARDFTGLRLFCKSGLLLMQSYLRVPADWPSAGGARRYA